MEPNGPQIDVSDFVMFKQIIAIIMLQEINHNIESMNNAFGYELGESSSGYEGPLFLDKHGLGIMSSVNNHAKISSWNIRDYWDSFLQGSIIYFCSKPYAGKKDINPIFHPSSCYYMSAKNEDIVHLMDSGNRFDMIAMGSSILSKGLSAGLSREMHAKPIRSESVQESFFQNSTVQGDYGQWYSVWKFYMDSFCKYNDVHGLHFYSVLEPESVQEMYDRIPKGRWTEMADKHHEYFMREFAADLF